MRFFSSIASFLFVIVFIVFLFSPHTSWGGEQEQKVFLIKAYFLAFVDLHPRRQLVEFLLVHFKQTLKLCVVQVLLELHTVQTFGHLFQFFQGVSTVVFLNVKNVRKRDMGWFGSL